MLHSGDSVTVVHVLNTDAMMTNAKSEMLPLVGNSAIQSYYKDCCLRAEFAHDGISFQFRSLRYNRSISDTILEYTEANLTDLIIMGSVELTDPKNSLYLGSVSAAVSKRTLAHVLVAKNFA